MHGMKISTVGAGAYNEISVRGEGAYSEIERGSLVGEGAE